ncbi:MAG: 30S ribosome-binding factor RbfA [Planctomycetes bacterium]|nr:30S ribosome-binding factor RbfA [Planctomycetota bacterium]
MPRPFRRERVASVVQEIVSEAIARRLSDPRIAPLTTVTRVEVTADLLVAKVYFSVVGDDADERRTLAAIRHARGFIQRIVARELTLRQCPELRFDIDQGAKRARETLQLLEENRRRSPDLFGATDDSAAEEPEDNDDDVVEDDEVSEEGA